MVTSGVRVAIAAWTASRISGCGNRSMTASTSASTSASGRADRALGHDEAHAGKVGQAAKPGRTIRCRVDANHFIDTAGDEIGDRRPALQAEASENRDLHAGSLRSSDQQPSGRLTHLLQDAMTTKVSLRTTSPGSPAPGISSLVTR